MSRHYLFFAPEQETGDFHSVLQQVQEYTIRSKIQNQWCLSSLSLHSENTLMQ